MTIYAQPKAISFGSLSYKNGKLDGLNPSFKNVSSEDSKLDDIRNSELFSYLTDQKLNSITFKSKSTDQYSFICKISKLFIKLKLQSSIKIVIYSYNIETNELHLNKRKVDESFYSGFLQKLEVIAKKAMQGSVEMSQEF
tara:strand:- start:203 stop:622 length:420 start_codon:yes stop_codon:yes gene_type:complete